MTSVLSAHLSEKPWGKNGNFLHRKLGCHPWPSLFPQNKVNQPRQFVYSSSSSLNPNVSAEQKYKNLGGQPRPPDESDTGHLDFAAYLLKKKKLRHKSVPSLRANPKQPAQPRK
jgi:hypothetical protein